MLKSVRYFKKSSFLGQSSSKIKSSLINRYNQKWFSTENNNDYPEYVDYFQTQKLKIKDFNDYLHCLNSLSNVLNHDNHENESSKTYINEMLTLFPDSSSIIYSNNDISKISEVFVTILQKKVEMVDPNIIVSLSEKFSKFDAKFLKGYWHFVEFLLTRTQFLNIFGDKHIIKLLESYYQIENSLETDKFQYILDKMESYICTKKIQFKEEDLTQLLFIYAKCRIGGAGFYKQLFDNFNLMKYDMKIENFVSCAWSLVNYNLTNKDKSLRIFYPDVYENTLKNLNQLNSYNLKQFLWAYHKEKEILSL